MASHDRDLGDELLQLIARRDEDRAERIRTIHAGEEHKETAFRLQDGSLAGADLSGLCLSGIDLVRVDLRGACYRKTCCGCLTECVLEGVDAAGSHFSVLDRCRCQGANLAGADIGGRSTGCNFSGCDLHQARLGYLLHKLRPEYKPHCFDGANLRCLDAPNGYMPGSSFKNTDLTGARLSRCDLPGCDFTRANLSRANLVGTKLTGAITTGAIFNKCLVTPGLAEELGASHPDQASTLRGFSRGLGSATRALVDALGPLSEYRIEWRFRSPRGFKGQKAMITRAGGSNPGPLAHTFETTSHCFVHMYPMDDGPRELTWILQNLAADYADWPADPATVQFRLDDPAEESGVRPVDPKPTEPEDTAESGPEAQIVELVRSVLVELFPLA